VNNFPKVVTKKWNGRESNPGDLLSRKSNALTVAPPGPNGLRSGFLGSVGGLRLA